MFTEYSPYFLDYKKKNDRWEFISLAWLRGDETYIFSIKFQSSEKSISVKIPDSKGGNVYQEIDFQGRSDRLLVIRANGQVEYLDQAMMKSDSVDQPVGGIDMGASRLRLKEQGDAVSSNSFSSMENQIDESIIGFVPMSWSIKPLDGSILE